MSSVNHREAELKFWHTPELVDSLHNFLDLESTLRLAQCNKMSQSILQGKRAWRNLIKKSSPLDVMAKVDHFVDILKLLTDYEANMPDLLDAICEANPLNFHSNWLQVSCPNHPNSNSHAVSSKGLHLLEKVEGTFRTALQPVEYIPARDLSGYYLSLLAARLSRQQQKCTISDGVRVLVSSMEDAVNFKVLLEAPQVTEGGLILMAGREATIEAEVWEILAKGVESCPGALSAILTRKDSLDNGKTEDVRRLWDALTPTGRILVESHAVRMAPVIGCEMFGVFEIETPNVQENVKKDGEGWTRLSQIMDLSEEQWTLEIKVDTDDEEEDSEDMEEEELEVDFEEEGDHEEEEDEVFEVEDYDGGAGE